MQQQIWNNSASSSEDTWYDVHVKCDGEDITVWALWGRALAQRGSEMVSPLWLARAEAAPRCRRAEAGQVQIEACTLIATVQRPRRERYMRLKRLGGAR